MLEIGAIIDAGRQQHDGRRLARPGRRDVLQYAQQVLRVVVHRPHPDAAEKLRECPLHGHAVLQQVRYARRAAAVVLQHEISALAVAHHVAAANVDVDVLRHRHADHLGPVMLGREHVLRRNHLFLQDALVSVEVLEEQIQRLHALGESLLDHQPLGIRNDPGHEIERKNALRALLVAVDGERDALAQECRVDRRAPLVELVLLQPLESLEKGGVVRPHLPLRGKHFVKKSPGSYLSSRAMELERKSWVKIVSRRERCSKHDLLTAINVRSEVHAKSRGLSLI